MKNALITGVNGQDGAYLSRLLLNKGYKVFGTSRDAQGASSKNLEILGISQEVELISMVPNDFRSVYSALSISKPDEIYYLAGQSSVGLSFDQPAETIQSTVMGTLNILEAVRMFNPKVKIYNASSSECFGDTSGEPASEKTPFYPKSPYAVAKASAFWLVNNYREAYQLHVSSGILFNHESPLRSKRFVTQKIIQSAKNIAEKMEYKLRLGNIDISRDWGWAPDYVEAMWLMLQQEIPKDYVIATGKCHTLTEFIDKVFAFYGLNYLEYLDIDHSLVRPADIKVSVGNPYLASIDLGWKATHNFDQIVINMIQNHH